MLLAASALLLLGLFVPLISYNIALFKRKPLSVILSFGIVIFSISLVIVSPTNLQFFSILLLIIAIYQLFNLYRFNKSHINLKHLRLITQRSGFRLWAFQLGIALISLFFYYSDLKLNIELVLGVLCDFFGFSLFLSIWRSRNITKRVSSSSKFIASNELPTLSVAIPARNESESLLNCLASILKNDYPKLEVFVLDDSSTDRKTPQIIRSFAHDGVEFIPGKEFSDQWLAKNWAYQQLLEAANGELILFCGADVRLSEDSLRFLVSSLVSRDKQMLSVMPNNELPVSFRQRFFQPLRYAWEIGIPRRSLRRPPVLPTCWLARREFLNNNGGFKAVRRRISPESYFAKQALKADGYSFFRYAGILSQKPNSEQFETSVRLRYPQLHRQVESVMFATLVELLGGIASLALLVLAITSFNLPVLMISLIAYIFIGVAFSMLLSLTYQKTIFSGFFLWPLYLALDIYLMNFSMWRYEFGVVLWKERSIAPSVMHHDIRTIG